MNFFSSLILISTLTKESTGLSVKGPVWEDSESVVTMEPLALKTQTEKGETLDAGMKMWIPVLTLSFTVD